MSSVTPSLEVAEVYSVREIARAASVPTRAVLTLIDTAQVTTVTPGFLGEAEAIRAVRLLNGAAEAARPPALFQRPHQFPRVATAPFAASTALHVATVAVIALLTALGLKGAEREAPLARDPARLVFLAIPGPGGGGGGGGVQRPEPPARAELKGKTALRSPVRTEPRREKPEPRPEPRPRPNPMPAARPAEVPTVEAAPPVPPVEAPVAPQPADEKNQAGVPEAPAPAPASNGPGSGSGTGSGHGAGMGDGKGSGVGAGEGGGAGGGPYRPGSGITPPALLREVRPQYTEDARRLGVEGDVVLEIVVRSDGSVGHVTVLQRLGSGLDQRAVDAVRQWRFSPAKRFGTPVDVLVEVAVEFKLR